MTNVVPFRLLSEQDRQQVAGSFIEVLNGWFENWFQFNSNIQVHWLVSEESPAITHDKWFIWGEAPDLWMAWKQDDAMTRDLLGMMFNASIWSSVKTTPLMHEILKECATSLAQAVFAACGASFATEPVRLESGMLRVGYGSGTLFCELQGKFLRQEIAIGGELAARLITPADSAASSLPTLAIRAAAIVNHVASFDVVAGHAELTLHDLANLDIGDVIRLDATVHTPFVMRAAGGAPIAKASLGIHGNHKAIQLIED